MLHAVRLASAALTLALDDPNNALRIDGDHINVCQDFVLRDHTKLMRAGEWEELFTSRSVAGGVEMIVSLDFDDSSPMQGIQAAGEARRRGRREVTRHRLACSRSNAPRVFGVPGSSPVPRRRDA